MSQKVSSPNIFKGMSFVSDSSNCCSSINICSWSKDFLTLILNVFAVCSAIVFSRVLLDIPWHFPVSVSNLMSSKILSPNLIKSSVNFYLYDKRCPGRRDIFHRRPWSHLRSSAHTRTASKILSLMSFKTLKIQCQSRSRDYVSDRYDSCTERNKILIQFFRREQISKAKDWTSKSDGNSIWKIDNSGSRRRQKLVWE